MPNTISGVQVVGLVQDWRGSPAIDGASSGFRRYLEVDTNDDIKAELTGSVHKEELPGLGSAWSNDFPHLLLVRIEVKRTADDPVAPRQFDCYYESRFINTQGMVNNGAGTIDYTKLETSFESSSEIITLDPAGPTSGYKPYTWAKANYTVVQSVYFITSITTIKVIRMIKDILAFENTSKGLQGRVNNAAMWNGVFQPGIILYNGYTSTPFVDGNEMQKWRTELTFTARRVTGGAGDIGPGPQGAAEMDGWNYCLNENRTQDTDPVWDRPFTKKGTSFIYLYAAGTMDPLFYAGAEISGNPAIKNMLT